MPTNIRMLDNEHTQGAYIAVVHNSFEASMRLFMTIARWRACEQGEKALILTSGTSSTDSLYKKLRQPLVPYSNGSIELDNTLTGILTTYEAKDPFSSNPGAINIIDELFTKKYESKIRNVFFIFRDRQNDSSMLELKRLFSKWNMALYISMPDRIEYEKPYHTIFSLNDGGSEATLKTLKWRIQSYPNETLSIDPASGMFIIKPLGTSQLNLQEVTAQLYDLRSFADQQKNPEKVKELLNRYAQLNPSGPKRPSFMT